MTYVVSGMAVLWRISGSGRMGNGAGAGAENTIWKTLQGCGSWEQRQGEDAKGDDTEIREEL